MDDRCDSLRGFNEGGICENFFRRGVLGGKTVDKSSCNIWHESSVFDVLMDEPFDGSLSFVHRRERDGFVPPVTDVF